MIGENSIISKVVKYFKKTPGSIFVLMFMILLVFSAVLLILKKEDIAEKFANWGFVFLIIGVIFKIFEFKKKYKDEGV